MLAGRLKECRKHKKVAQREVAEYLSMTVNAYQKYELATREPNIETLLKLADYFEVSTDYLLGRTDIVSAPCASK